MMTEVASRLDTIDGLRVFAYPQGQVRPPAAIVSYPEDVEFDVTYVRGLDRIILPVVVLLGRPNDRGTRDRMSAYAAGSGPASIKAVLESGTYTAFDLIVVTGAQFDPYTDGGVQYLGGVFMCEISGSGA